MKFMKLGSRPDTFHTTDAVRTVTSEVSSDLIIHVQGITYLLHKFPLLSKCLRLQKLCAAESPEPPSPVQTVHLQNYAGGLEAFEICAKFCYGMTITLSAYNVVSILSAAEYLHMTEDVEKGNLLHKIDIFLHSCTFHGWRDSIVTLQSTKSLSSWCENLGITSRCIEAIAAKVSANPMKVNLSQSHSRRVQDQEDDKSWHGSESTRRPKPGTNKGWWAEDLAELGIDLYWRTILAIKSGGKVPPNLIGDALRIYASRWLPRYINVEKDSDSAMEARAKQRQVLESVVSLLPPEKGAATCNFLLKLLKACNILNASSATKMDLARRVGLQLEEATVVDLLLPRALSSSDNMVYDVDVVMVILDQFLSQGQSPPTSPARNKANGLRVRSRSTENMDLEVKERRRSSSASHSSKLKVAKLVDGYLQEIAKDSNLPLSMFIAIAGSVPEFSRIVHDDLYKAIDIYLKVHPELDKSERKCLCQTLDCKKLSMEVCMHAAQNEMLPLRVVVQVLFCEQARSTMNGTKMEELPSHIKALLAAPKDQSKGATVAEDQWSMAGLNSPRSKVSTIQMKLEEGEDDYEEREYPNRIEKSSKSKPLSPVPNKPKRMFSKLWSVNRTVCEKN